MQYSKKSSQMNREVLTRSKTRAYEAFYHKDLQQYKMLPPKGEKRKLKDVACPESSSKMPRICGVDVDQVDEETSYDDRMDTSE